MNFPVYILRHSATISTAISALQLKAGTNGPIELLRAALSQGSSNASAQCAAGLVRCSAGATVTTAVAGTHLFKANPLAPTADAALGTSSTGVTATAEGTETDTALVRGFNVLNGFEWLPTPEERIIVPQGGIIKLKFLLAPPSATWYSEIVFRELRGG